MTTTNSTGNSLNSSGGTFNSNSSLSSTPSADRYAALKDLDEQLREAKVVDTTAPSEPAGNEKISIKIFHRYLLVLILKQEFLWIHSRIHSNSSSSSNSNNPIRTGPFPSHNRLSTDLDRLITQMALATVSTTTTTWQTASSRSLLPSAARVALGIHSWWVWFSTKLCYDYEKY